MESSDEEIIENNYYDDEYDQKTIENKNSKDKNVEIKSNIKPPKNNINQIKSSNTIPSSQQSPKTKQIISVSVILPKKTQNTKRNINKNNNSNNPFRNPETKPKFKTSNEVYQEIKDDIDVTNHNNIISNKKEHNNNNINSKKKNLNKIKRNKIENITITTKNNNMTEIGNNMLKKIDKIKDEFLSNTFLNTTASKKSKKSDNKNKVIRNTEINQDNKLILNEQYNTIEFNESANKKMIFILISRQLKVQINQCIIFHQKVKIKFLNQ